MLAEAVATIGLGDGERDELAADFAAIYLTHGLSASPYESVWLDEEGLAMQGPMFQTLAEANPCIDLRFYEREDGCSLGENLRINGAMKVPVVVFLSEDFYELGRFGDRLLTVYRRMAVQQLGPSCETGLIAPPANELEAELCEWVDVFERMHLILRLSPHLRDRYGD